ncbi:hypothetical protein QBC34DRAFT_445046 [Podospora aff. communis PSN243]|uniref:Cyclodipeptide synthase n=1 Tax=Podospora aff. communis PSN243 TaxID=3040156 RepID=A0AAV9H6M5_9PEZI|nr:hypothetical protein QBC34DRAFT_445046 [Podospora aff. communis PSN243]
MTSWSPAWGEVEYRWETFQNGFSQPSIYRGEPTEELELAWNASLQRNPILIPREKLSSFRRQGSSDFVTGTGTHQDSVVAHLEVFRDLACLNLLRQHTYRDEHDYRHLKAFQGSEEEIMTRVDACVQRLRQVLMCSGDATPYLIMVTPKKKLKEAPDFNTLHYCRNFDRILEWTRRNEGEFGGALPSLYDISPA